MRGVLEAREVSAWIEPTLLERADAVLADPRLRVTRIGSSDVKTRRHLAERFDAEAFDDLRQLAVATPSVLWIARVRPLDEPDQAALSAENIAVVGGACSLPFLMAIPQAETAPSFRRTKSGRALLEIAEAFGSVDVLQATVSVGHASRQAEGLRVAAAAAIAVLGPIDQVAAFGAREGTIAASVLGSRGFGTIAVGTGVEGAAFTLVGEGGLASVTTSALSWRRCDGTWVEDERIEPDGVEPIVRTILEAEKPESAHAALDERHRRFRWRIAALADTIRLSARTGQAESVEDMLRRFRIDPDDLVLR